MQVTLTADEPTVERVARALYAKWCASVHQTRTWDELIAQPDEVTPSGQGHGDALRVWRYWARAAIDAAVDQTRD